jgi:peptidoglycan/LPS O-acetylase OafA/YrhL
MAGFAVTTEGLRSFHRVGDYSYGLYIYAFPIQQLLLNRCTRPILFFAASYPISLAVAVLSWHFVESPCLSLKKRLRKSESGRGAAKESIAPLEELA